MIIEFPYFSYNQLKCIRFVNPKKSKINEPIEARNHEESISS